MLQRLVRASDRLIGIEIDPLDRITLIRARLLFFCVPLFGLFGGILVALYVQSPEAKSAIVFTSATASAVLLMSPLILYATKSIRIAGGITLAACLGALLPEIVIDRGFYEAEAMITVLLPVLGAVLVSRRGATMTYGVTTLAFTAALLNLLWWPPASVAAIPPMEHVRYFFNCLAASTSGYIIAMCFVWLFQVTLRDLQTAITNAEAASEAKTTFLANMSHEIRTPINSIIGFSKLSLASDLNKDERAWVGTIKSSGETLLGIVNDILDVSKLEAGAITFEEVEFSIRDVVNEALVLNSQASGDKGLYLGAVVDPDVPDALWGDPGRLRQVVINLLANAIKFTDQGGVVVNVTCSAVQDDRQTLRIDVVDTGIGVPEDKIPHLFDRFTQADASPTRRHGGTGLGLAICKDLIDLMGGKIGVQSVQGRGSVFWFTAQFTLVSGKTSEEPVDSAAMDDQQVLVLGPPSVGRNMVERQLQALGVDHRVSDSAADLCNELSDATTVFLLAPTPSMLETLLAEKQDGAFTLIEVTPAVCGQPSHQDGLIDKFVTAPIGPDMVRNAMRSIDTQCAQVRCTTLEAASPAETKGRILLAEDNASNQLLFKTLLVKAGYTVDIVTNGFDAIKAVRQQNYTLVLMDGQMPEMSGVEAAHKIRNEGGPQSDIPIIAITANTMTGDREQYLRAGMNDYLAKPIEFDEFFEKVDHWANVRQMAS